MIVEGHPDDVAAWEKANRGNGKEASKETNVVTTRAQYDKLPSGAAYTRRDGGRQYFKP